MSQAYNGNSNSLCFLMMILQNRVLNVSSSVSLDLYAINSRTMIWSQFLHNWFPFVSFKVFIIIIFKFFSNPDLLWRFAKVIPNEF